MNLVASLENQNKPFWIITGSVSIIIIGILDYLTGYEMAFSLFYLFPVTLLTWFLGRPLGYAASLGSAAMWLAADIASGNPYTLPVIVWNSAIRFSFFLIVTLLLAALKESAQRERELSRMDNLTGAANGRFLTELMQREIDRSQRDQQPFSLVYIDLDNFKSVNDQLGHSTGDRVLRIFVQHAKNQLRKVDTVARLGGDEFALLMPETDQAAAQTAMLRVLKSLQDEMVRNNWPVTFSVGVLTCTHIPQTCDELLKRADDLMYTVKNNGKDSVRYAIYKG